MQAVGLGLKGNFCVGAQQIDRFDGPLPRRSSSNRVNYCFRLSWPAKFDRVENIAFGSETEISGRVRPCIGVVK